MEHGETGLQPYDLPAKFLAHERPADSSEDHFSDASEGEEQASSRIPKTRVEKVDNLARHGEVAGTEAFAKRALDAEPDEIEVLDVNDAPIEPSEESEER